MTEKQEYDIFIVKLMNKVNEFKKDFNELSANNKIRFNQEMENYLKINGFLQGVDIRKKIMLN